MKKKFMNLKWKKATSLLLSVVLAASLAACGKQEAADAETEKEYVYVPEYISLSEEENVNFYNMVMSGNSLYYISNSYDEESMTSETKLCEYSLETRTATDKPIMFGETRSINTYAVASDGSVYTVEYEWPEGPEGSYEEKNLLCKYDAQGAMVMEQDISKILQQDEYSAYVSGISLDAEGRIYMACDEKVCLFDAQGNYQGDIAIDNGWIQAVGTGKDGKVYMAYYDYNSQNGSNAVAELDFAAKQRGTVYANFPNSNGGRGLIPGVEKDFLINDGSRVYEYDLATQTSEEILTWLDCDINGNYVEYVGPLEDGRLVAVVSDWNTGESEIACLTKTNASEVPQKEQITIGTISDDSQLQAAAVAFNKQSDTYHINIKTYYDRNSQSENSWNDAITRLNNDIISGSNCPDIIDVSSLNVEQLAAKGVFEDLTPYLEKSTALSKDDFFENVLECYTYDGKLVSIPSTFMLSTIVGKTSEVGEEMGWTLEDMMAYSKEHPEAQLFHGASKAMMMYYMLSYNQDAFVDWATGECKFDSDEFKQVLEFVNSFPDEYEWSEDESSPPVKIQAGEVLLNMVTIYELNTIQEYEAMFGEPVTYIGYPTSDGGSGCYISASQLYAITSKSDNKDGAWAFIENFLCTEDENGYSWGLPTIKERFEKKVEEETKVEYVLDENGEPVLDENGEPIVSNGTSSIGYGDWEYTYHVVTEEEVAIIRELISVAQPASVSNDEIMNIINEEAEGYFQGQKSVDDVAGVIQSRVKLYVNENR